MRLAPWRLGATRDVEGPADSEAEGHCPVRRNRLLADLSPGRTEPEALVFHAAESTSKPGPARWASGPVAKSKATSPPALPGVAQHSQPS